MIEKLITSIVYSVHVVLITKVSIWHTYTHWKKYWRERQSRSRLTLNTDTRLHQNENKLHFTMEEFEKRTAEPLPTNKCSANAFLCTKTRSTCYSIHSLHEKSKAVSDDQRLLHGMFLNTSANTLSDQKITCRNVCACVSECAIMRTAAVKRTNALL